MKRKSSRKQENKYSGIESKNIGVIMISITYPDINLSYYLVYPDSSGIFQGRNPYYNRNNNNEKFSKSLKSKDDDNYRFDLFCNRLICCSFAVALLWLTSLQICVGIVGLNIGNAHIQYIKNKYELQ